MQLSFRKLGVLVAAGLASFAPHAFAAEPTVTLTQSELTTLIQGACAEQQALPAMRAAAPVMDKVRKAFAPPAPKPEVRKEGEQK